jgi:hypothetical protein
MSSRPAGADRPAWTLAGLLARDHLRRRGHRLLPGAAIPMSTQA